MVAHCTCMYTVMLSVPSYMHKVHSCSLHRHVHNPCLACQCMQLLTEQVYSQFMLNMPIYIQLWLLFACAWSQSWLSASICTQFMATHCMCMVSAPIYTQFWLLIACAWSQSMLSTPVCTQFWPLIAHAWSQSMLSAPVCTQSMATHCVCMVTAHAQHACMYTIWPLIARAWSQPVLSAPICTLSMATHCVCMVTAHAQRTCMYTIYGQVYGHSLRSSRLYVHSLWLHIARAWSQSMLSAPVCTQFMATYMVIIHAQCACMYSVYGYSLHVHGLNPCSACP